MKYKSSDILIILSVFIVSFFIVIAAILGYWFQTKFQFVCSILSLISSSIVYIHGFYNMENRARKENYNENEVEIVCTFLVKKGLPIIIAVMLVSQSTSIGLRKVHLLPIEWGVIFLAIITIVYAIFSTLKSHRRKKEIESLKSLKSPLTDRLLYNQLTKSQTDNSKTIYYNE